MVELIDHTALVRPGQQRLQPPGLILREVVGVGTLFPIGRKDHHRVHGNNLDHLPGLVRAHRPPAAAGQSHHHYHGQQGRCKTFHRSPPCSLRTAKQFFCHIDVVYHAPPCFSTGNLPKSQKIKNHMSLPLQMWEKPAILTKYVSGVFSAAFHFYENNPGGPYICRRIPTANPSSGTSP